MKSLLGKKAQDRYIQQQLWKSNGLSAIDEDEPQQRYVNYLTFRPICVVCVWKRRKRNISLCPCHQIMRKCERHIGRSVSCTLRGVSPLHGENTIEIVINVEVRDALEKVSLCMRRLVQWYVILFTCPLLALSYCEEYQTFVIWKTIFNQNYYRCPSH